MEKRSSFKGSIGFVLAAAGSAVGLGNIWRFPYLAARDGGGLFLVIYLILALTFGFTMLTSEVAIGRKTKNSPLTAYSQIKKGWKPLGIISCIVPIIIMPYYCVIGGWVLKYLVAFITGNGFKAAKDGYFGGFITDQWWPIIFFAIFLACCAFIIFKGVNSGIEKSSKIIMPALIILVLIIAGYVLTIGYTDPDTGVKRTSLEGLKIYVVPDLQNATVKQVFNVIIDAMCQLFYSLSIAMGIMIAYGSYVSDDSNLAKSVNQIEIFDTAVAFLAGVMIIPAVYVFMGKEGMQASGPSLMFVTLPRVFKSMGWIGNIIGALFFFMVFFAALSSAISIMEAVVSSFMDQFKTSRVKATTIETVLAAVVGIVVCLGYNIWYFEVNLGSVKGGQILDLLDYVSNNVLMPISAIGTCLLIGWIVKPKTVTDEVEKNGEKMGRKILYKVMIKFIAPILLIIILLKSFNIDVIDLVEKLF